MKLFKHIAILSFILATTLFSACIKTEIPIQEEEMTISYCVSIPETKAPVSVNGGAINKVWYALYNEDGTLATNYAPVDFIDGNARCEVVMFRDRSYRIVFVAQHYSGETSPTYPIDSHSAIVGLPDSPEANSDKYDLFYGTQYIANSTGAATSSIVLDRIVAMVNFISNDTDWASAVSQDSVPTHSSIKLTGVCDGFNLLEGKPVSAKTDLEFAKSEIPEDKHIGAVFCIAEGKIGAMISLYASADQNAAPVKTTALTDIPVEANRKTNIVGEIINSAHNL